MRTCPLHLWGVAGELCIGGALVGRGYLGRPTIVNNTETLAAVPWIITNGGKAYRAFGTEKSPGTKLLNPWFVQTGPEAIAAYPIGAREL